MSYEVTFHESFRLSDGFCDFLIEADVDMAERIVERVKATVAATGRVARLTPAQRAVVEERALEVADERWATE